MPFRIDSGTLGKVQRTPQGGVIVPAMVTRTGVQSYRNPDGSVRNELRPMSEVLSPMSLATLADAPVTIDHPLALVTPETFTAVSKGHARGDAQADSEGKVTTTLVVQDAETIARIDARELIECSMGYSMDFDPTPGELDGVRYDGVQRNIRYNHVALGPYGWARAGREAALRLDSNSAVLEPSAPTKHAKGVPMKIRIPKLEILHADRKLRIDGVTLPLKTAAQRLTAQEAMHRALHTMREDATRTDAVEAATLQALMDAMGSVYEQFMSFCDAVMGATETQEVIPTPADAAAADAAAAGAPAEGAPVEEKKPMGDSKDFEYRLEVIDHARRLAPKLEIDTKSKPRIVMDSVLKHLAIEIPKRVTGDEGVAALFFATKPEAVNAASDARRAIEVGKRSDGNADPVAAAKQKMRDATSNAWRPKASA